ncbi:MAG: GntG family PLP-dependent aldolase [Flavobacteriaceae bacterium]|nr:GntG family PLP-dependent aldolase [Flavobacteriaceae bacterium]
MTINLISDTVTLPTKEMLSAMMQAEAGDDVFGADPTVNKLQEKIAGMFGMEAALFFPSGTMANQTAIMLHTKPGDEIICDKWAHVYNYESGGPAANSGVACNLIDGNRGMFTADQVRAHIKNKEHIYEAFTSLVTVENTTNKGGGACWDIEELKKIRAVCSTNDLAYHLDGARLFNALVAKNQLPKHYGELFDTISVCLSKGLGCPIGSLLLGSKAYIKEAVRIRKRLGGGMRQVGYIAAAGIYALEHHISRLTEDHKKAKAIAEVLQSLPYIKKVEPVETNILIFNVQDAIDEQEFVKKLKDRGILIVGMGQGKLRIVTHLDFTDHMLEKLITELKTIY